MQFQEIHYSAQSYIMLTKIFKQATIPGHPITAHYLLFKLNAIFRCQAEEVIWKIRCYGLDWKPDFSHWNKIMVEWLQPLLLPYWRQGGMEAAARIASKVHGQIHYRSAFRLQRFEARRRKHAPAVRQFPQRPKNFFGLASRFQNSLFKGPGTIGFDFSVFRPEVLTQIQAWTYTFCKETNDTAAYDLQTTLSLLKSEFAAGMSQGNVISELHDKVNHLFLDNSRAFRIATTETSRATHGGQLIAAKESGVVEKKRWLASADACERCLELNGKEVGLDEPFFVDIKPGPYQNVMFPPLHPHCMCAQTEVF